MTSAARHRFRHLRRILGYGALVLLILFATAVGIAKQALPLVERHPERIAQWLGERVGEPVAFDRAHAEWTRRGPSFTLENLRVGEGAETLRIGRAQLQVAMYSGLLPGRPLTELKVRELALTLAQGEDRRWTLIGLPGQESTDPLEKLEGFGELHIEKARLTIQAPRSNLDVVLPRVDLRIRVGETRVLAGATIWADMASAPLHAVADLGRVGFDGSLYGGGEKLSLRAWSPLLAATGVQLRGGDGRVGAWAHVSDQRVDQVTIDSDVAQLALASRDVLMRADGKRTPVQARFERVQATARWRLRNGRWDLQAPMLRFTRDGREAALDGLYVFAGETRVMRARSLDLSPLASLIALSPKVPMKLRTWLDTAQPHAVLNDVELERDAAGHVGGRLQVVDLALAPAGTQPGVSGLGMQVRFDGEGGIARLAPARVHFAWPVGFRQALDVTLDGSIGWWRDGAGWKVGTSALQIDGGDFSADARVEVGFQGDGSRPTLDVAADLGPASFAAAKKFWVMHKMPASAVHWLDGALVSGRVTGGRVAIAGDLDDWPFRNHTGVFDARAHISDATVRFSPDWPAGQHLEIDTAFDGPGFSLVGTGELAGNQVSRVEGGIADFSEGLLHLDIAADGRGESLRALLLASPIAKTYGEHLRAATIEGPAQVQVAINLPLNNKPGHGLDPALRRVAGNVRLTDASLADSRWDIAFDHVNGIVDFTDAGFATQPLDVQFEQQPARFELKVGAEHTGDPRLAGLGQLHGRFAPVALLRRYPALDWLGPYLEGTSAWDVQVRIPATVAGQRTTPPSQLRLSTDLRGTAITLPAPLAKPADAAWPLEVSAPLPVEQGEVQVLLANVLHLRAVLRENAPMRGSLLLGGGLASTPPAQGLIVRGAVDKLDAAGWIAFSAGGGDTPSPLREIDLQAREFTLMDRVFPDTRLRLERAATGTKLAIDGASLQGTVEIPSDANQAVQGRFARMWWASAAPAAPAAGAGSTVPSPADGPTAPTSASTEPRSAVPAATTALATALSAGNSSVAPPSVDSDPTRVPPLRFTIDDLRLGKSQLGKAELATARTANGMRIDRFETRHKSLNLTAAGEWVRAPGGSRSNLRLDFKADSLGQMLDALGFTGMVDDGKTHATLAGSWPGSPGAFSLARLSGTLHADVGEGHLNDVEPGGSGRILGLISLAEIPRRLTLDFSDFFQKGFAFNTVRGDFSFSDGQARTENLRIDGPAAEIHVSGAADLRKETYDQRVEVLPKAGGVLPAIGMLAGGPAGAAVGVVAQAVFQKPLKQTTRTVYKITGPWKKPDVVVIEKGPAPREATPPKPRNGEQR